MLTQILIILMKIFLQTLDDIWNNFSFEFGYILIKGKNKTPKSSENYSSIFSTSMRKTLLFYKYYPVRVSTKFNFHLRDPSNLWLKNSCNCITIILKIVTKFEDVRICIGEGDESLTRPVHRPSGARCVRPRRRLAGSSTRGPCPDALDFSFYLSCARSRTRSY